jgi:hypothetical protein
MLIFLSRINKTTPAGGKSQMKNKKGQKNYKLSGINGKEAGNCRFLSVIAPYTVICDIL